MRDNDYLRHQTEQKILKSIYLVVSLKVEYLGHIARAS